MNYYKVLNNQIHTLGDFSIVPIRYQDRFEILKWRNEQIYHLRQNELLTIENQNNYFDTVILNLFDQEKPDQILFSFLKKNNCIGYGGLVKINWIDKNAEISFVMNTVLEEYYFEEYWRNFLKLLEEVAFNQLHLHKVYTYAYDIRTKLYNALELSGFKKEATLKDHCFINDKFYDVIIHSKIINSKLELINANEDDAELFYKWANDSLVRHNSLNEDLIVWKEHLSWYSNKIKNNSKIYILVIDKTPLGQIRFDFIDSYWLIDYSIDCNFRGRGYGKKIIELGIKNFNKGDEIRACVRKRNIASIKIFNALGFCKDSKTDLDLIWFSKII